MKAYRIERDGNVVVHEGEPNFWMNEDIVFGATNAPHIPGHAIYYDEESLSDPGEVRVIVAGVEVPLPAWFVGTQGHLDCDPRISPEDLKKSISLPG